MQNTIIRALLLIVIAASLLSTQSCSKDTKTTSDSTSSNNTSGGTTDFVKTENGVQRVSLNLKPKKGDILKYKIAATTISSENSPATQNKELKTDQISTYYITEEVSEVDASGIITYKVKYDSVDIVSNVAGPDSTFTVRYNSNNKNDTITKSLPEVVFYNSSIGQDFYMRVRPEGEISDIYGLEKIYEALYKGYGDTLSENGKAIVRENFGPEAFKTILQQQFQILPKEAIAKDSSWTRTAETQLIVFPAKNVLTYKLKDIATDNNQTVVTIEGDLGTEVVNKEYKDRGATYKIEDINTSGKGTIKLNLTKGCVSTKETNTDLKLTIKASGGGQSITSVQTLITKVQVQLL